MVDLHRLAALRTFMLFPSRVERTGASVVSLPYICAQGSEFLATSVAKLAEKIERISVGSDKLAKLGKTLVGFKISIEDFYSYFVSA